MVFWIGILVGGAFAWFAIKRGFYETWALVFNIVIAIYLAVFLGPVIADIVPSAGDTLYGNALCMLATAIGSFLILHAISYTFLTGQFSVPFQKIFDTLGSGFLGFLAGFLVWSFVSLLICITPISQNSFVKEIGFSNQFQQTSVSYISRFCNLVNSVVSSQDNEHTTQRALRGLLKNAESKVQGKTAKKAEPNEPAAPGDVETGISGED